MWSGLQVRPCQPRTDDRVAANLGAGYLNRLPETQGAIASLLPGESGPSLSGDHSMRFGELWLLEAIIEAKPPRHGWIPVALLPDSDPNEEGWGRGGASNHHIMDLHPHRLTDAEVLLELRRLFDGGDIVAAEWGLGYSKPGQVFVPSDTEIQAGFRNDPRRLCYTFTEWGLARWEEYAKPNWAVFQQACRQGWDDSGRPVISIEAATQEVGEQWIRAMCELRVYRGRLDLDQVHVREVRPWQVYPFKTLPEGVCVTVPIQESPPTAAVDDEEHEEDWDEKQSRLLAGLKPWYQNGVSNWTSSHG